MLSAQPGGRALQRETCGTHDLEGRSGRHRVGGVARHRARRAGWSAGEACCSRANPCGEQRDRQVACGVLVRRLIVLPDMEWESASVEKCPDCVRLVGVICLA